MNVRDRWLALPDVEWTVECSDEQHPIRWSAGRLHSEHHDLETELILATFGGVTFGCLDLVVTWQSVARYDLLSLFGAEGEPNHRRDQVLQQSAVFRTAGTLPIGSWRKLQTWHRRNEALCVLPAEARLRCAVGALLDLGISEAERCAAMLLERKATADLPPEWLVAILCAVEGRDPPSGWVEAADELAPVLLGDLRVLELDPAARRPVSEALATAFVPGRPYTHDEMNAVLRPLHPLAYSLTSMLIADRCVLAVSEESPLDVFFPGQRQPPSTYMRNL